nr:minus agglutinin [Haemonchus contortus]
MAYVPSSDVPSAFLISSDADAVLLDLLGTFVLLDGGSEKVLFTKHVRQIDANVISAPTKAALTNAVELNKETVVPLVGNIPTVKSAGSDGSVAGLLKSIEHASETRPVITPTRFNPKYEPIVISKSLRSGRLELIVLAGDLKEVEALHKAVETGDEHIIEKAASNHGTISVLVWFPARQSDPIKRILHTGTAPLSRIIFALEKARSLPFLHSPVVSTANAFKEVPPPARITNSRVTVPPRVQSATAKTNSTAAKPTPTTRRPVTTTAHGPPSRTTTTTVNKTSPSSVKPSPARPAPTVPSSNRARTVVSSTTVKHTAPANKTGSSSNNKKTAAHEAPIQKTTVNPVKGAAMSRASAAIGKAAGAVVGKTSAPVPVPAPEEVKEPAPTPVEPTPPLDDSVVCLDDVVPDICVDAPQDPASSTLRPAVELVVIPPTPEPRSQSGRSSVDGPLSPAVVPKCDDDKPPNEQHVLPSDDDKPAIGDLPSPVAADTVPHSEPESHDGHEKNEPPPSAGHEEHDSLTEHKESPEPGTEHKDSPKPTAPNSQLDNFIPEMPSGLPDASGAVESGATEPTGPSAPVDKPEPSELNAPSDKGEPTSPDAPVDKPEPSELPFGDDKSHAELPVDGDTFKHPEPSAPADHDEPAEPTEPNAPVDKKEHPEPSADGDKSEPVEPSAPPLIPMPDPIPSGTQDPHSPPIGEPETIPQHVDIPKSDDDSIGPASPPKSPHTQDDSLPHPPGPASPPKSPHAQDDSLPHPPFYGDVAPAEPFVPPSLNREGQASPSDLIDVPEEFKSPHKPQEVGENGLLDDLEEPPRLMKISMDTDDLKRALERGATAVADQLAQCLDELSLSNNNSDNDDTNKNLPHEDEPSKTDVHDDELHKKDSDEKEDLSKNDSSNPAELARKLSRQMIEEASTPLASALASALTDAVGAAQKVGESAYEGIADLASSITETVTEGVKDAAELAQEKMKAMQTRSSLVENDDDNHSVKYEKTDPVIDSVLETVASDSDRVDHALSNGGSGLENKENGKKPEHEVDEDGFRLASADHDLRLHLPPLTAARGNRAASVPHLSRPLFFELVTVPHLNGKCTITDEQSAIEYFTNIRSANYILHSEDVSPAVLDGWLAGKKQWFRDDLKCRLIPTRHHSALMAFVTAQAPELEEHGLVINSSLEHNSISINTEDGREDYHMIKIEL